MNRIILIGNGFDLAHGLPTRYEDFIMWYWEQRLLRFANNKTAVDKDVLCRFKLIRGEAIFATWADFFLRKEEIFWPKGTTGFQYFKDLKQYKNTYGTEVSEFMDNICRNIEMMGWVDIEEVYYRLMKKCKENALKAGFTIVELNEQLACLCDSLQIYLEGVQKKNQIKVDEILRDFMYESIKMQDVSISGQCLLLDSFKDWLSQKEEEWARRLYWYGKDYRFAIGDLCRFRDKYQSSMIDKVSEMRALNEYNNQYHESIGLLPERILFLSFNYTNSIEGYVNKCDIFKINYIHGKTDSRRSMIFGYGDELDKDYKEIQNLNDNEYLRNMKSDRYLESSNYRDMLSFIESAPYQIYIMGHSCGNSDRTLLNTLFEHRNCVTIKPFYHKQDELTDNYLDIVQNISRNFTDMKLMRDRVVNKTFCSPLPQSR